jgi:hypothetical protein
MEHCSCSAFVSLIIIVAEDVKWRTGNRCGPFQRAHKRVPARLAVHRCWQNVSRLSDRLNLGF